jgi:hypothetical protein
MISVETFGSWTITLISPPNGETAAGFAIALRMAMDLKI